MCLRKIVYITISCHHHHHHHLDDCTCTKNYYTTLTFSHFYYGHVQQRYPVVPKRCVFLVVQPPPKKKQSLRSKIVSVCQVQFLWMNNQSNFRCTKLCPTIWQCFNHKGASLGNTVLVTLFAKTGNVHYLHVPPPWQLGNLLGDVYPKNICFQLHVWDSLWVSGLTLVIVNNFLHIDGSICDCSQQRIISETPHILCNLHDYDHTTLEVMLHSVTTISTVMLCTTLSNLILHHTQCTPACINTHIHLHA